MSGGRRGKTFCRRTRDIIEAGLVELAHVELQAYNGKHKDGHKEQQANLQQWDHGLHDRLEHHL